MVTYADLFAFVIMLIALLTYVDHRNNKHTVRNMLSMFLRFAGALVS